MLNSIQAKSGLKKAIFPETFLMSLYRCLAPYRGCGFGCLYCDGRAEKYYVDGDFERDIAIRKNLPELLSKQIKSHYTKKEYGPINIGSGVTDIYQPIEKELGLTRKVLEILTLAELPIVMLTKSSLVLRDFDLLKKFSKVLLVTTITTTDPEKCSLLEPNASPPGERLNVIRKAKEAGFFSGVMAMPLCPALSDTEESTMELFNKIKEAGADFICPGGLTLRPGRQKNIFIDKIRSHFDKSINDLYDKLYSENRQSGIPHKNHANRMYLKWRKNLMKLKVPGIIPHSIYKDLLSPPDCVYILLEHMQTLYKERGINTYPLKKSIERYSMWLKSIRTKMRRKRTPPTDFHFPVTRAMDLELRRSDLSDIFANPKLAGFISTLLRENVIFDYNDLKITGI